MFPRLTLLFIGVNLGLGLHSLVEREASRSACVLRLAPHLLARWACLALSALLGWTSSDFLLFFLHFCSFLLVVPPFFSSAIRIQN